MTTKIKYHQDTSVSNRITWRFSYLLAALKNYFNENKYIHVPRMFLSSLKLLTSTSFGVLEFQHDLIFTYYIIAIHCIF